MAKSKTVKALRQEYQDKYGDIPIEPDEILNYLKDNIKIDMDKVNEEECRIDLIPWQELDIIIPVVPKPTPRPRNNFKTGHFYVEGAAINKKLLKEYIDKYNIIYTQTEFHVETYQPTPLSVMKKHEIYLAEKGKIRPLQNPDRLIITGLENTHLIAGT